MAGPPSKPGDTIVLSTADRWGNMVSWVNSNTYAFGSGLTVDGYGFVLHSRGWLFSLEPDSPNVIEPRKRPFNTLTAAFVMKNGKPLLSLTMMGGYMQAQGHMQALINLIDFGANVQAAGDMARWFHDQVSNTVYLEPQLAAVVGPQLSAMGHRLTTVRPASAVTRQSCGMTRVEFSAPAPTIARTVRPSAGDRSIRTL